MNHRGGIESVGFGGAHKIIILKESGLNILEYKES